MGIRNKYSVSDIFRIIRSIIGYIFTIGFIILFTACLVFANDVTTKLIALFFLIVSILALIYETETLKNSYSKNDDEIIDSSKKRFNALKYINILVIGFALFGCFLLIYDAFKSGNISAIITEVTGLFIILGLLLGEIKKKW